MAIGQKQKQKKKNEKQEIKVSAAIWEVQEGGSNKCRPRQFSFKILFLVKRWAPSLTIFSYDVALSKEIHVSTAALCQDNPPRQRILSSSMLIQFGASTSKVIQDPNS